MYKRRKWFCNPAGEFQVPFIESSPYLAPQCGSRHHLLIPGLRLLALEHGEPWQLGIPVAPEQEVDSAPAPLLELFGLTRTVNDHLKGDRYCAAKVKFLM